MLTVSEALAAAIQHHHAGRLQAAEQIYRQILQAEPNQPDATHLLGVIAQQTGKPELAVEYLCRAIGLKPAAAEFHYNLAKVYQGLGRKPEAVACCRRALELRPDFPEAHVNLGNSLREQGKPEEAIPRFRRALELKPDFAEAHYNLGLAFRDQGKPDEAAASLRRALELEPGLAEAHHDLGLAFRDQGKLDDAIPCFHRTLELKPDFAEAHHNLGLAFMEQRKLDDALASCRRALERRPDLAEAHNNLGVILKDQGKLDEAIASLRRALELKPELAAVHNNLGLAFKDAGRLDEAITCFRRAIALEPPHNANDAFHSNLVLTLHYHPAYDAAAIHEEHRRWNRRFAEPVRKQRAPHANDRNPDRRILIGYVSPDFRDHVAGRNVLPILEQHDHSRFKVFCYASVAHPDALTERFQKSADVWRNIVAAPHQVVADLIRDDRIDLLVDLTMHTANSRLPVFARKPAPVQVSWAGYPGDTGLETIDYHLTDPYLIPPEASGVPGPELHPPASSLQPTAFPLPHSFWCYDPPSGSPSVNPLPALSAHRMTFGSLNNFCKVNEGVIALWSRVLGAVRGSRLLLLSKQGAHRDRALHDFERRGVAPDRIDWLTPAAQPEYLAAYHRIDLGLDTFPYNGHTTSLDSAWMGVPVITLVGKTIVGRGGLSQSMNLGLPELIASTPEQYVQIAAELAQDLPRLSRLRATLRARMQASPLMDAPRFTRNLEAAYRQMWQRWCTSERLP